MTDVAVSTAAPGLLALPELPTLPPAARVPKLPWDKDRAMVWGAHLAIVAPLLFLFKDAPGAIALIVAAMACYHVYRLVAVHKCGPYGELGVFHVVFVAPLLLMTRSTPNVVALVAWLMAAFFAAKFALAAGCKELHRRREPANS